MAEVKFRMEKSSKRGKIPQADWPLIMARYEAGETLSSIARTYDCSPPAISYIVSRSRGKPTLVTFFTKMASLIARRRHRPRRSMATNAESSICHWAMAIDLRVTGTRRVSQPASSVVRSRLFQ